MAACTDSHRQHVRGFVHKSPGRHSFQGFVQAGSDFTAMGGFSPSHHQSNAHPRSLESRGGHAFEEENSSRGMEVTPRVGSDDLEPLRESVGCVLLLTQLSLCSSLQCSLRKFALFSAQLTLFLSRYANFVYLGFRRLLAYRHLSAVSSPNSVTIDPFTVYVTGKFKVRSAHVGVRKFIPSL